MTGTNSTKAFFDTNVLLYMYGGNDRAKQARAEKLFEQCVSGERMLLSTQVVQEFYAVASRKLGMARDVAREAVFGLLSLPLVIVGPAQIAKAIENEERFRISFWDGLILAAAEAGGAGILYTEDLNDGQQYGAVLVRNPFARDSA
jgi:predicted nucleic acid-binding protein